MSFGGIKVTPADSWFSKCIRERAEWTCEYPGCGRYYPEGAARAGLHCSHYIGRRNHSTRYEPLNGLSLCYGHHALVGGDPVAHTDLILEKIGEQNYEILLEKKRMIVPKADRDLRVIAKHFKLQYEAMRKKREAGQMGYLNFQGWI